jgi:hypothetical protein
MLGLEFLPGMGCLCLIYSSRDVFLSSLTAYVTRSPAPCSYLTTAMYVRQHVAGAPARSYQYALHSVSTGGTPQLFASTLPDSLSLSPVETFTDDNVKNTADFQAGMEPFSQEGRSSCTYCRISSRILRESGAPIASSMASHRPNLSKQSHVYVGAFYRNCVHACEEFELLAFSRNSLASPM